RWLWASARSIFKGGFIGVATSPLILSFSPRGEGTLVQPLRTPCPLGQRRAAFFPSPLGERAGLLHMSKEFEEEVFTPGSEFHFSGWRALIWMCIQDIERDPADKGEILRCMVFARAGIVFMEHHIERPMKIVFDAPMQPDCLQRPARGHPFGQGNVVDIGFDFAASLGALAFDAREHDKAWKLRRVFGRGNGADTAALKTAVAALAFLVKSSLAKLIGLL